MMSEGVHEKSSPGLDNHNPVPATRVRMDAVMACMLNNQMDGKNLMGPFVGFIITGPVTVGAAVHMTCGLPVDDLADNLHGGFPIAIGMLTSGAGMTFVFARNRTVLGRIQ